MKNQTICIVLVFFFTVSSYARVTFNKPGPGGKHPFFPAPMGRWSANNIGMGNPFSFKRPHFLDNFKPVMDMDFGAKGFNAWFMRDAMGPLGRPGPFMGPHSPHNRMFTPGSNSWMTHAPNYDGMAGCYPSYPGANFPFAHKYPRGPWDISCDSKMGFSVKTSTGAVPAPGALLLGSMGVALVSWLRRNRTL